MRSFSQFLVERNGYTYLFHGTSSAYSDDIKQYGLVPGSGESGKDTRHHGVYLTTDFHLAVREAKWTVEGENRDDDDWGTGGRPMVVVVDRAKVHGLKRDPEYHISNGVKSFTAFWTPNAIPATAVVEVVPANSTKYRDANRNRLVKQVGVLDKDGNAIVDLDGEVPDLGTSRTLKAYTGANHNGNIPPQGVYWTTNPNSASLSDYKYKWYVAARPEEFTLVDQSHGEVWVEPSHRALRTAILVHKDFNKDDHFNG